MKKEAAETNTLIGGMETREGKGSKRWISLFPFLPPSSLRYDSFLRHSSSSETTTGGMETMRVSNYPAILQRNDRNVSISGSDEFFVLALHIEEFNRHDNRAMRIICCVVHRRVGRPLPDLL